MNCCARCGRKVYYAERKIACGNLWHSFCFSCCNCRTLLDECSFHIYNGELYCNVCIRPRCKNPCVDPCGTSNPICYPCHSCKNIICDCCNKPIIVDKMSCPPKISFLSKPPCCQRNYCLQAMPVKKCNNICMCDPPTSRPPKPRGCSPCRVNSPKCHIPIPTEVANYYNRKHDDCPCYRRRPPADVCCVKSPCTEPCGQPPHCCPPCGQWLPKCPPEPQCDPCYTLSSPICYPPIQCCEADPADRICYYPCPDPPCQCSKCYSRPKYVMQRNINQCCRRCGKKVYAAEKMLVTNGVFHTCCFSCYCCCKPLDTMNCHEHCGEIYCKSCHFKSTGLKGYGYGLTLKSNV